jgi:hypothetical protein
MDSTKIDKSILKILTTITINNFTPEQAQFMLQTAYIKEKLKFQIKTAQYMHLTEIDIKLDNYRQLLDNLIDIHNSTAYLKLITADSTFETAIKMSPKRFLFYADKIINDDVDVIISFI